MVSTVLGCHRLRKSVAVVELVSLEFRHTGAGLPTLILRTDYRKRFGQFAEGDAYHVEEFEADGGRGFLLHRFERAIENDGPDGDFSYGVLLGTPRTTTCTCRGFQAHGRCKHVDALRFLAENGHLDKADAGAEEPCPECQGRGGWLEGEPGDLDFMDCPRCSAVPA